MPFVDVQENHLWVPVVTFENARVALGGVDHFGEGFEGHRNLRVIGEFLTPTRTFCKFLAVDRARGDVLVVDSLQGSSLSPTLITKINSSYEQLIGSIGLYSIWFDLIFALGESREEEIVKAIQEAILQVRAIDDFEDAVWPESLKDIPRLL